MKIPSPDGGGIHLYPPSQLSCFIDSSLIRVIYP